MNTLQSLAKALTRNILDSSFSLYLSSEKEKKWNKCEICCGAAWPRAGVVRGPAVSAFPKSLLEMQILRLLIRPAESESAGVESREWSSTGCLGDLDALECLGRDALNSAAAPTYTVRLLPPSYEVEVIWLILQWSKRRHREEYKVKVLFIYH